MLSKHFKIACDGDVSKRISIMLKKWNRGSLIRWSLVSEGRINVILKVDFIESGNLKQAILRVCIIDFGPLRQMQGREIYLRPVIDGKEINFFPKVYFYDDSKEIIPFVYMFMEYIYGEPLNEFSSEENFFLVGNALARLHNIKVRSFGKNPLEETSISPQEYYLNYFIDAVEQCKKVDSDIASSFYDLVVTHYNPELYKDVSPVLLHHDFHSNNIIVQGDNNIKIIDWDSSRGGLPEYDFVKFKYINAIHYDDRLINSFLEGYMSLSDICLDVNYFLYEICWLMRMVVFETHYSTDDDYYPKKEFYKEKYWFNYYNFRTLCKDEIRNGKWIFKI